jgi:hypothetical protein
VEHQDYQEAEVMMEPQDPLENEDSQENKVKPVKLEHQETKDEKELLDPQD